MEELRRSTQRAAAHRHKGELTQCINHPSILRVERVQIVQRREHYRVALRCRKLCEAREHVLAEEGAPLQLPQTHETQ